jgi:hypothetical protein
MKFNKTTIMVFMFMMAGVGLVINFIDRENQSTTSAANPFELTKEEAVKKGPPSVRVYFAALENTKESPITFDEFLRCARQETGYNGLFDKNYNPYQTSAADAQGAWQVRVVAARAVWGKAIAHMSDSEVKYRLKHDIEWNSLTAIKYAEKMYKMYGGNKAMAFAAYNKGPGNVTSSSDVNGYARAVVSN